MLTNEWLPRAQPYMKFKLLKLMNNGWLRLVDISICVESTGCRTGDRFQLD